MSESRRDPGGGGINVARVLKRFGTDVTAIYPPGGTLGLLLSQLVDQEGISQITIPIANETREDFTVNEHATGFQYRFVLPGPQLAEHEWQACLTLITALEAQTRFVVCSGSLPPGVPNDFYHLIAEATRQAGRQIIVDSSGAPLKAVLAAGVYLLKPSLSELRDVFGAPLDIRADQIDACRALVEKNHAEVVALTLGEQGAILATRDRVLRARALPIEPKSVVGAGDSFFGRDDLGAQLRARAQRSIPLWRRRWLGRVAGARYRACPPRGHRAAGARGRTRRDYRPVGSVGSCPNTRAAKARRRRATPATGR